MKALRCQSCGSGELKKENGYWVCQHCGTKNYFTDNDRPAGESEIRLNEDVMMLLRRWDSDPGNAKKYAQLILQMDPHNRRALDELSKEAGSKPSGGCYIATAVYGSYDCPQVWTLRRYRDNELAETVWGRAFIRCYYAVSPSVVRLLGNQEWFIRLWRNRLDRIVSELNGRGVKDTPYRDRNW